MAVQMARVPTLDASRYVQRLCDYWARDLDIRAEADRMVVRFPDATVSLLAQEESLGLVVAAAETATTERIKEIVTAHLEHFALPDGPLHLTWTAV
jgi:hypothetical protein